MHFDFPVFDGHCDSLTNATTVFEEYNGEFSLDKIVNYSKFIQVAAIWVDKAQHIPFERACHFANLLSKSHGFKFIKTKDDLNCPKGIILGIEGGEAIEGKIDNLIRLYEAGVRVFGLTWNTPNEISDTALNPKASGGLTDFGIKVVKKAEELGIVIDVSHISEKGFYDVATQSEKPFVASHSNSKALCNHDRNLTDEQFKVIIGKGGVAGINYYTDFLGNYKGTDGIIAHIEHFLSLGGEKNIGLGSDFDGGITTPDGINDACDHKKIINEMLKRNYGEELVKNISFCNFERVFKEVLR